MPIYENIPSGIATSPSGAIVIDVIEKWGSQVDVDTADAALGQILWPVKATVQQYLFLDAPIQLYLVSTSANDAVGGTGARSIEGTYHDENGEEAVLELDTNGITNVPLPTLSYGCFRFALKSTGALNTCDGDLNIVDGGGNIYSVIKAGEGQTQISVLRVPSNRQGRVKFHKVDYARAGSTNDATMRLRVRKADGTRITKWDPILSALNTSDERTYSKGFSVEAGEWVFWECTDVNANNTPLRGTFDIDLEAV